MTLVSLWRASVTLMSTARRCTVYTVQYLEHVAVQCTPYSTWSTSLYSVHRTVLGARLTLCVHHWSRTGVRRSHKTYCNHTQPMNRAVTPATPPTRLDVSLEIFSIVMPSLLQFCEVKYVVGNLNAKNDKKFLRSISYPLVQILMVTGSSQLVLQVLIT